MKTEDIEKTRLYNIEHIVTGEILSGVHYKNVLVHVPGRKTRKADVKLKPLFVKKDTEKCGYTIDYINYMIDKLVRVGESDILKECRLSSVDITVTKTTELSPANNCPKLETVRKRIEAKVIMERLRDE